MGDAITRSATKRTRRSKVHGRAIFQIMSEGF
jgi:hypothetical protein